MHTRYALSPIFVVLLCALISQTGSASPGSGLSEHVPPIHDSGPAIARYVAEAGTAVGAPPDLDRKQLETDLAELVRTKPTVRNIRALAVLERALNEKSWPTTLLRLQGMDTMVNPFEMERELAVWNVTLGSSHLSVVQANQLASQIDTLDLGWYRHLALSALFKASGQPLKAASEERAANRASRVAAVLLGIQPLLTAAGLILLLVGLSAALLFALRPQTPVPGWLRPVPPAAVPASTTAALMSAFCAYIAVSLSLQALSAAVLARSSAARFSIPPGQSAALIAFVASLVSGAAAWFTYSRMVPAGAGTKGSKASLRSICSGLVWGVGGFLVALPLVTGANNLSTHIFSTVPQSAHPALLEFAGATDSKIRLLLILQIALAAPILEEVLFRGMLFRAIRARLGLALSVLCTSGLFAALHPQMPSAFLGVFVLGMVFNTLYLLRGSLLPGITAHIVNNSLAALLFALISS